jgi:hypothetical protein
MSSANSKRCIADYFLRYNSPDPVGRSPIASCQKTGTDIGTGGVKNRAEIEFSPTGLLTGLLHISVILLRPARQILLSIYLPQPNMSPLGTDYASPEFLFKEVTGIYS